MQLEAEDRRGPSGSSQPQQQGQAAGGGRPLQQWWQQEEGRGSTLERERAGLQRAQLQCELDGVTAQIAERQATLSFLQSSVSGHQLATMVAEMESLLEKQSALEAQIAGGSSSHPASRGNSGGGGVGAAPIAVGQTVLVQIPAHISGGQQLQVTLPDGRPFIFLVPPGVSPGQSVELSVPPPAAVVRVEAQPAPPRYPSHPRSGGGGGGGGGGGSGWRSSASGTVNRLGARIKSPRGQSESRAKYRRKLEEREATLRTLQSMGENTAEVEREIKAMRLIIEGDEMESSGGGAAEDTHLAAAKAASLTTSQSEAATLTKEEEMLKQAIDASHQSAVEDEVRRKEFLAEQIGQLEAMLLSEREAERGAAADWPPITRELRTEYNGHFVQLAGAAGHGGSTSRSTVSAATVWDFLQMSSLPEQTLRGIFELTVVDHRKGVDVEEFMLAMHITKGVANGIALPVRVPAHLLHDGAPESSERVLELEAALAQMRAEAAGGGPAGAGGGGGPGDEGLRTQLQEMETALAAVRYEKQLLETEREIERAENPGMGAVMGGGGGGGLSEQEVSALRAKVALLQKQLGDLKTDDGDGDDWDGTLESAHKALREYAERLMEGDESVQNEFDRWDQRISTHPDHLAAEAKKLAEWEARERPKFAEALTKLRLLVPPHILRCTRGALEDAGMPGDLTKRLWEKRCLWFVRMQPKVIAKMHMADLATKYSYHGCDITECRAVFAMLPGSFENDDGSKEGWRKTLRDRLMELGGMEEQGTLRASDKQHPAYREGVGSYRHEKVVVSAPAPGPSGGGGGGADPSAAAGAGAGSADAFNAGAAAQRELEMLRGKGLGGIKLPDGQARGGFKVKAKPKAKPAPPSGRGGPPPPPGALPDSRSAGGGGRGDDSGGMNDLLAAINRRRVD